MRLKLHLGALASLSLLFAGCSTNEWDSEVSTSFRCAGAGASIVGLESVDVSGTVGVGSSVDVALGGIFSNGDITVTGNVDLEADLITAAGSIVLLGMPTVAGTTTEGAETLTVDVATAAAEAARISNDNPDSTSNGTLRLTGNNQLELGAGTYYFDEINISGQAELYVSGPATIYVGGAVKISGGTRTDSASPADFFLISVSDADVSISGNSASAMNIIAPLARVKLSGTGTLTGTVVGLQVAISGTSQISGTSDSSFTGSCESEEADTGEESDDTGTADTDDPNCDYSPEGDDRCW